jgi:hypothetical protein
LGCLLRQQGGQYREKIANSQFDTEPSKDINNTATAVHIDRQNITQTVTQSHIELSFKKVLYFMLHTIPYRGLMKCNQVPNEDLKILICASII